jgi:thioesterase domain-containing protein
VQPEGPYYLCGWSSGGAIALEMSQRLRREGATVALLAVIDSAPFNIDVPPRSRTSRFCRQLANVPRWLRDDLLATPMKVMVERLGHRLRTALRQMNGAAAAAPTVRDIVNFPDGPDRWERFVETHYAAFRRYTPSPYMGRVSLILAPTQPLTWLNDAERAWRQIASDVDPYVAAGTHFSIVREPNVRVLAQALSGLLHRTGAVSSGSPERSS